MGTQLHNYLADFTGFYGSAGWRQSGLTGAHHGKPPPQTYVEPSAGFTRTAQCEAKTSRCRSPSLRCSRRGTGPGRRLCRSAGNAASPPHRAPAPLPHHVSGESPPSKSAPVGPRRELPPERASADIAGVNVLWCREGCAPRHRSRTRWRLRCRDSGQKTKGPGRLPPGAAARRR